MPPSRIIGASAWPSEHEAFFQRQRLASCASSDRLTTLSLPTVTCQQHGLQTSSGTHRHPSNSLHELAVLTGLENPHLASLGIQHAEQQLRTKAGLSHLLVQVLPAARSFCRRHVVSLRLAAHETSHLLLHPFPTVCTEVPDLLLPLPQGGDRERCERAKSDRERCNDLGDVKVQLLFPAWYALLSRP